MAGPIVLIFHRPAPDGDPPLVRVLADVRHALAQRQAALFVGAGASEARLVTEWHDGLSFGEVLAELAPARGGLIVLGSGAVARLNRRDARLLVAAAAADGRRALTNNRYSSDICAVSQAATLAQLPALPSDNALPRWLEERAGFVVEELPGRDRLALDIDTPLDVALATLAPGAPAWLRSAAGAAALRIPRLAELRAVARDPFAELLVFGRSSARTLRWLERNVRCRVRFLAEERGLRAASPLAIAAGGPAAADEPGRAQRGPRATLGRLLEQRGPGALADIVADLADGALIDSRVLLAHRFGADETIWPAAVDRFASDLQRVDEVGDEWLRDLTASVAAAPIPVLLGSHSLVGPGVALVLGR